MKYLPAAMGKKAYQPCSFNAITFLFYFIHFLDRKHNTCIHTHTYIFPLCVNILFFLLSILICNEV